MTHEQPRENVDYIVDLYQVAGVDAGANADDIKRALNTKIKQYHPDRLEGMAPEFQAKSQMLVPLLNRAKAILLDADKRAEYDDILTDWDGPVSGDGTPTIRMSDEIRRKAAQMTTEELAAAQEEQKTMAIAMAKHDPAQQQMFAKLYESAEGDMKEQLREAYDNALLAEDQVLAITQGFSAELLGIPEKALRDIGTSHTEIVALAIEDADAKYKEDHERRSLGGAGLRLALLAGSSEPDEAQTAVVIPFPVEPWVPEYHDEQVKRITEIAEQRQAVANKRFELFEPDYPIAELQTQAYEDFVIGVSNDKNPDTFVWIGYHFNPHAISLDHFDIPDELRASLDEKQYRVAYESGVNILTFVMKENLDYRALLDVAYNKHLEKYFPDIMAD